MLRTTFRHKVEEALSSADVQLNGSRPWDLQVHNDKLYSRVLSKGSLGLGEAYMEGWWDSPALDQFFFRVLRSQVDSKFKPVQELTCNIRARLQNLQSRQRAFEVALRHYDIGNDLYEKMLDQRMIYSCAYWRDSDNLDEAQEAKLDLVCRKLHIEPGMRVLDIGCGWGGTARYLAEKYDVRVVGLTVSKEQAEHGRRICGKLPVDIRLQDYRSLEDKFDRILSIGMFEHVGYKNYRTFMKCVRHNLKDNGLFLLHTIGGSQSTTRTDPWIDRYIFPNSMLPSKKQICQAAEGVFTLEDWHNFGPDYDPTLVAWHDNFCTSWQDLNTRYDESFYRMWKYYLLSCAASFRARKNHVWQIVFSPNGVLGGYQCCR